MLTNSYLILQTIFLYLVFCTLFRFFAEKVSYLPYTLVHNIDHSLSKWLRNRQFVKLDQGIFHYIMRLHIHLEQFTNVLFKIHSQWVLRKPYFYQVSVMNAFLALFSYHLASSHYAVPVAFRESIVDIVFFYTVIVREYNTLSAPMQHFVILVLCAPLLYHAFHFFSVRIFKMEKGMTPHVQFLRHLRQMIHSNITSIRIGRKDLLRQKVKEITAGIGYDLQKDRLVAQQTVSNVYDDDTYIRPLSKTQDLLSEMDNITLPADFNNAYLMRLEQDIQNFIQQYMSNRVIGLIYYEQFILAERKANNHFTECATYFAKNRNQIFKHKFTDARVVRKEALDRLDYYEGMAFENLKIYEEDLDNYYFCLLENRYRLDIFVRSLIRELYPSQIIEHLLVAMKYFLREYLRIVLKLAV